ncbi:hypothetical protein TPHA_0A05620 [Tetrapisispora phaffii CBS 4417]|uniref:Oligomycin resistance ATP-dependent permease YOR1 n=1 Tax=Tetrapisispora phaffii (strain ATCC 24235 / CBS 4417 / NBRC 1672 / NRRL Y-8282 / UCD 70-5) TaxID=1071381 RepID=G8BP08_TETPH|nr:hypothetical protein TPHA_0A05620 [Tetrapisispora phaffii CBS 4417]CCE61636.1 hypothetical protein TPHA_0A05620 [Tetrapisispora phaffii CBS 4417]
MVDGHGSTGVGIESSLSSGSADIKDVDSEKIQTHNIVVKSKTNADTVDLRRSSASTSNSFNYQYLPSGDYVVDRNKPKTFLNRDDLEKVTDSEVFPQKRLFSFFYSKKMPVVPANDDERKDLPLLRANIISKIFIWWVVSIVKVGYKRTIQPNDLFKMDERLSINNIYTRFEKILNSYVEKHRAIYRENHPEVTEEEVHKNTTLPRFTVAKTLMFTFKVEYFISIVFAVLSNCASGLLPLVTKRLITFVGKKALFPELHVNAGVGYAIGSCAMMVCNGILFNQFFLSSQLTGAQVKALLTKAILNKIFKADGYTRHKFPNGEITSYVTTDLARVEFALSFQPFIAGFPASLAICITLLIINLGPIALVGVGVFFAVFFVSFFIFKQILNLRVVSLKFTDARVTAMREVLNNMKMVKFYSWEDAYEKNITEIRTKEIKYVRQLQYIRNGIVALSFSLTSIASLVTFLCMYKVNHAGRTPANVFSSLSLFQVLSLQMFFFPIAVSTSIDMFLGLDRIQNLLQSSEMYDSFYQNEMKTLPPLDESIAIKMNDASFIWPDYEKMDKEEALKNPEKDTKGKKKDNRKNAAGDSKNFTNDKNSENSIVDLEKTAFTGFTNLNFEIKKGEFVMITGPIGTGKTSLLNSFAGFMEKTSGTIQINGDLLMGGYPWIQNATVRDNIIFGSPYEEDKYKEVLRACSLESDLDILPAGDKTEIGERGITLSGGQKARINLARCVYKEKDIYLLDDVLSAVDSRVGKHIMDECLTKLIGNKTRLLATHQLSLIDKASRIIVLGNDGSVEIGDVQYMKETNKTLKVLLENTNQAEEEEEEEERMLEEEMIETKEREIKDLDILEKTLSRKDVDENINGRTIEKEERAVNSIKLSIYKEYLKAGLNKWGFIILPLYLILVVATTFSSLFSSVWLSYWTENKFENRSESFYMGLYSFFVFGAYIFMTSQFTILCYIGIGASKNLNIQALKRIIHTPMSFMDTTPIGRILNRFTKDTDSLDNELIENVRLTVSQFANIVGVCVMCIVYLPWFAIAVPFLVFIFVFIQNHYQSAGREIKRLEAIQRSFVYNNFNEILGGMDTIKFYKSEERYIAKSDYLIDKMNEAGYLTVCVQRWVAILVDMIAVAFALIITLLCVTRQFHISASSVGVLLTYVLQLPGLFNTLLRAVSQVENDMNSTERLVSYATDLPLEAQYHKPETAPPESWPEEGTIKFENVDFAYRPGLPIVLKNINLQINGTEKIGICGRTGAGKSTIMTALYRLNELTSGSILIDDVDINKLGLHELRKKLAIIPQDPVLFRGDIRKNLDPFHERTDEELWDVLVRGGAIAPEDLAETKAQHITEDGTSADLHKFHLDKVVEEDGANFSLGERQILALTRALVRNTKILILDEATSSVDYETDRKIQERIATAFSHCTILCIAHRLKTILNYDRILVLEHGEVAEFDTPMNLFKDETTIFHNMCKKSDITIDDFSDL